MEKTITTYEAPRLTRIGSLEDLTQGGREGARLDAAVTTNTPASALTFS